jgi:hypothetical protein
VRRLKIAIDPALRAKYGPEVCWTWRLLLSAIGFAWEEVSPGYPSCDIFYGSQHQNAVPCRLNVSSSLQVWDHKADYRLVALGQYNGCSYPIYESEPCPSEIFHLSNGSLLCQRDLIFDVFWLVTGQEERYFPKNKHGHFDLAETTWHRACALRLAAASSVGSMLQRTLLQLGFLDALPRWPLGKKAAACVSHDVDYPAVVRWLEPLRIIRRRGLNGLSAAASVLSGRRHHWHFSSWVRMEQGLNTRSAFYFVPRQGSLLEYAAGVPDSFYNVRSDTFKKLFKYLADEGCEIGLHASYRAYESQEKFAAEIQVLEEASGQKVFGNRHHYWHLDPDDPESTLMLHEQIGLKYDTSLAHERYVGWRRGLSWPFFPFHRKEKRELRTLQISTVWMDDQLFGHRVDNPGDRTDVLRVLADTAARQGGCLHIDVHDYVFDDVLFPGWARAYRELWQYVKEQGDFWIDTPHRIADYWTRRYRSIVAASRGLTGTEPAC